VIDTAGLRSTDDAVERIGIERTWAAVLRADLAIVLVDARAAADALDPADAAILDRLPGTLPRIVVHNKADLARIAPREERRDCRAHVWLSALTGDGVDRLERAMLAAAGVASAAEDTFIARARHVEALREAATHLAAAAVHIGADAPPLELFAEELREAQDALSSITGEFTADDLLGVIFSRFCIGK
jgi:tRNA modification GTPase